MDPIRRNLLLGAGASLGGAALVAPAAAARRMPGSEVALLSTYVSGTAYHAAGAAAAALRPGDPLDLRRERGNDYDARAIAVRTGAGQKLGYLPRIDNQALANLMDAGFPVGARVRQVAAHPRHPEIRLEVFMTA